MESALLVTAAIGGVLATGGALWNAWQIGRLASRVDHLTGRVYTLERTMQTVLLTLAGGGRNAAHQTPQP